jgi:hypothetical protein
VFKQTNIERRQGGLVAARVAAGLGRHGLQLRRVRVGHAIATAVGEPARAPPVRPTILGVAKHLAVVSVGHSGRG